MPKDTKDWAWTEASKPWIPLRAVVAVAFRGRGVEMVFHVAMTPFLSSMG